MIAADHMPTKHCILADSLFKGDDVGQCGIGNRQQGILSKKTLMAGHDYIGKHHQTSKYVILNNFVGQILIKQIRFFFIDIQSEVSDTAAFSPSIAAFVSTSAAACINQHYSVLHLFNSRRVNEMMGLGSQGQCRVIMQLCL